MLEKFRKKLAYVYLKEPLFPDEFYDTLMQKWDLFMTGFIEEDNSFGIIFFKTDSDGFWKVPMLLFIPTDKIKVIEFETEDYKIDDKQGERNGYRIQQGTSETAN